MWNNVLDDDLIKFIVQAGTELLKFVDNLGVVKTLVIGIGTYLIQKNFKGDLWGGLFNVNSIEEAKGRLKGLQDEIAALQGKKQTKFRNKKIQKKQNQYSSLDATIKEYDVLTEKVKKLRIESDGAKKAFEDYNTKLANKAAKGKAVSEQEIAHLNNLNVKYNDSVKVVQDTEDALKKVEAQAYATGTAGLNAGNKIKAGFKSAGKAIWQFSKEMLKSMAYTMAITAIFEAIGNIGQALAPLFDQLDNSYESLQEDLSELQNELSSVESELNSLESELKSTDERIEELIEKGPLTFVEQEELNKLKSISTELKSQIGLQKTLQESLQKSTNSASVQATTSYLDTSFMSEKSKSERQEKGGETGAGIGQIVGTALGALGFFGGPLLGAALMAVGSTVGSTIGKWIGEAVVGSVYDSEQSVGEAMDDMLAQRAKLKQSQADALAKNDAAAYNEATEALAIYDKQMATHISQIQQNYNAMDWETATTEERNKMIEYADWLDKYNISMGTDGAKSNAIARIFGDEATGNIAKARNEIEKLKKNLTEAKKNGEGVDEALAALKEFKLNLSEEEIERLRAMGIYLYEVEDYFKDVVEAESEFVDSDLEDVAKDINKITDGLDSLKTAFDEVIESGVLTAKTISSLKDALGIGTDDTKELTSAWNEYLKVMMSGTASTEEMAEATEKLTQAWIEDALANNSLTPETKMEYIAQLRSLGVENAAEYVEDLLQKNMVKELEGVFGNDRTDVIKEAFLSEFGDTEENRNWFDNLSQEQIEGYAQKYGIIDGQITESHKQEIMERYGIEEEAIDGIIDKINEKSELERQLADAQNTQDEYRDFAGKWSKALQDYQKLEKDLAKTYGVFTNEEKNFSESGWSLSADGRNYVNVSQNKSMSKNAYEELRARNQEYKKMLNSDEYKEYRRLEEELIALQNSEYGRHWVNADLTLKDGVDSNFKKKIEELKLQIENIDNEIDETYTVDIQLELDLQNKSELVDDIQNVFDTLANAQKEYEENGYLSVDTLQSLLQLEPKYLDLLVDEEGNLNLTKDALYDVARARIIDMGIQSQKNILEQANALASKGSSEALREQIEVMQDANEVGTDFVEVEMAKIRAILAEKVAAGDLTQTEANAFIEGTMNQIKAVQVATQSALDNLDNSLSSSGNTATEDAKSKWERLVSDYENRLALIANERDLIQAEIDKAEARGGQAAAQYYEDLKRNSQEEKRLLTEKKVALENYLAANAQSIDQDTWTEYNNEINETAVAIKECEANTLKWAEALREIDIHYFEQTSNEISRLGKELDFVNSLLEDEDVSDENGNWSAAALTRMGMYMNQIEAAAADTQRYQNEISKLNQQYAAGELSEEQYQDRLATLTDGLYDSINAQEDARDGIVELNEARIDAIKEGIEKEIEAYEDYIDTVKESLDAERDLYDFKKKVKDQTKDINQLERRIASLSGATDASSVAERRKLEAQLLEAKEGLNDTYYDHSKDAQQNALDSEAESYRESQERRIEELEKTLEDTETLIYNSMMDVLFNADVVYNELNTIADTYGIKLSDELTEPWNDASNRAINWKNELEESMTSGEYAALIGEGGAITLFANGVADKLSGSWDAAKNAVKTYSDFLTGTELGNKFSKTITGFGNQIQTIIDKWNGVKKAADAAYAAQTKTSNVGGNSEGSGGGGGGGGGGGTPKKYHTSATLTIGSRVFTTSQSADTKEEAETAARQELARQYAAEHERRGVSEEQYTKFWNNTYKDQIEYSTSYYAKGTTGTSRDQWAITDEPQFGDELVLVPGKDGNLSYMRKGTGVVPADLTANLMEWGQFTPDSLNLGGGVNVNMINNAVIKPQYDFNFDSLVHVDNCSQETLKDLEKMVDNKIDKFSKDLNYSIKRFAR